MIDESKLEEFVKDKCFDLLNMLDALNFSKREFLKCAEDIKYSDYISCRSENSLSELRECSIKYKERRFMLSQFVHVLGDRYVKIYEEMMDKEK